MAKKAQEKNKKIYVYPGLFTDEELADMRSKYGDVECLPDELVKADIILAPNAWRMTADLKPLVKLAFTAMKNAVKRRKPVALDLDGEEEE